jgi:chemotaxis signal transduction protein
VCGAVLLFARDGCRIGLAIDDVYDAIVAEEGDLRSAPGTDAADGVLVGVIRRGTDLVAVLDANALLGALTAVSEGERT